MAARPLAIARRGSALGSAGAGVAAIAPLRLWT